MPIQAKLKKTVKGLPVIGSIARKIWRAFHLAKLFPGSGNYWEKRYTQGGTSGAGSYNRLATFKAEVINSFVEKNGISSVIEYGSGDGNQLKLACYKNYIGFDVSKTAIEKCRQIFSGDQTKKFKHTDEYSDESAELSMSLDVIYHLVEDPVFDEYMKRLFDSAGRFVIVYSSNDEALNSRYGGYHVKHRKFSNWVEKNAPDWELMESIPNKYPHLDSDADNTSLADFYFYGKRHK